MALGAARRDVVLLVLQQGVVLAGVGALVGAVVAAVTGRSIAGLLFGIQPSSPLVILGGPLLMMAVAVAAATIPALRAARVDPVVALRLDA